MMRFSTLGGLALAAALATGCVPQGGDRDGDPGTNLEPQPDAAVGGNGGPRVGGQVNYPNGVDSGDQVDELDEGQREAACEALATTYANALSPAEAKAFGCGVQALFAGALDENDPVGTCDMAYGACLSAPPEMMEAEGEGTCPLVEQPECTATLAEIEACIQFGFEVVEAFNDAFECALIEDAAMQEMVPGFGDDFGDEDNPCTILDSKCPGLLDDDEDETDFETAEQSDP